MNKNKINLYVVHKITLWITTFLYLLASLTLVAAAFCLSGKAIYEIYDSILVKGEINKEILDAITYTVIAIAVCDVGRYLVEEEVEHEKKLNSPTEARRTITRFMVIITIALSLEGLVGVFEAGNNNMSGVMFPIAIVICAIVVLIGLGVFQRLSVGTECLLSKQKELTSDDKVN